MICTGLAHGSSAAPSITAQTTTLRTCISGGASLPLEILRGFEEKFGCVILEGYGLSETSPVASFAHPGVPGEGGEFNYRQGR